MNCYDCGHPCTCGARPPRPPLHARPEPLRVPVASAPIVPVQVREAIDLARARREWWADVRAGIGWGLVVGGGAAIACAILAGAAR